MFSLCVHEIIIYRQQEEEGEEQRRRGEEVPQIVIVIKVSKHRITRSIHIAGLCRAQIPGLELLRVEIPSNEPEPQEQNQEEEEEAEAETASGPCVGVAVADNLKNLLEEILGQIQSRVGGAQKENRRGESVNLSLRGDDLDKQEQYHGGVEEEEEDHHGESVGVSGLVTHVLTQNRDGHSVGDLDSTIEIIFYTQINDEAEVHQPAQGMEHNLGGGAGDVQGDRLQEDEDTEGVHGGKHVGGGVWMPKLKCLDEAEHHHHVHHALYVNIIIKMCLFISKRFKMN